MNYLNKYINYKYWILLFNCIAVFAQQSTVITGKILDQNGYEIPYAAIGILNKNTGSTTTEDGAFYFRVPNNALEDTLTVSSLGFSTFSIKVNDFLKLPKKEIILEEKTTALSEVVVNSVAYYVKNALKELKSNTVSKNHQLNILYRRWSVEDRLCRFFIEHNINAIDRGPSSYLVKFSVEDVRTSADYRFIKNEQNIHALKYMVYNNPLRKGISLKAYKWDKIGDSSYDNEDIIIAKGKMGNKETIWLYIGMDSYKIYKLEMEKKPKTGKSLTATYIYKKNNKGLLYLSYHQREWQGAAPLPENIKKVLKANGKPVRKYIPIGYRHEAYVLDIEENKSRFKPVEEVENKDMTQYKKDYNASFWKKLNIPPNTRFYNKNIAELTAMYGVPIEKQFKYSNMR